MGGWSISGIPPQRGPASVGRIKAQQRQLQKQEEMAKKQIDELANEIATDLLTVFDGQKGVECTRMACMLSENGGNEIDMGGRNKDSMINVIREHLRRVLDSWE